MLNTKSLKGVLAFVLATAWMTACILSTAYAESWSGKVVSISDGDTITVMHENKGVKIRLAEIDCPESGQPFVKAAKRLTSDLCFAKVVVV